MAQLISKALSRLILAQLLSFQARTTTRAQSRNTSRTPQPRSSPPVRSVPLVMVRPTTLKPSKPLSTAPNTRTKSSFSTQATMSSLQPCIFPAAAESWVKLILSSWPLDRSSPRPPLRNPPSASVARTRLALSSSPTSSSLAEVLLPVPSSSSTI